MRRPAVVDSTLLVDAVRRLSAAQTTGEVQEIVRTAARGLAGADGATVILRDGEFCHYVDEDAIGPLWKGQRLPIATCIGGWVMRHREPAEIPDIYTDERIPQGAYRPTFVTSLAMVPIRSTDPIGAIGNYWAEPHVPQPEEVAALQALADATSVALENVRMWSEVEELVADQTSRLRDALELNERMLGTLAHEVRNCLMGGSIMLDVVLRGEDELPAQAVERMQAARRSVGDAAHVVETQLTAVRDRAGALDARLAPVDVGGLFGELQETYDLLRRNDRVVLTFVQPDPPIPLTTDEHLLKQALRNLVGNALKFTDEGEVRIKAAEEPDGRVAFSVTDTGLGIAPEDLTRIFSAWEQVAGVQCTGGSRGAGLGLPFVKRIAGLLGGDLAVRSRPGAGSTFTLTVAAGT